MRITNGRSDIDNPNQVNYGLKFDREYLNNGIINFDSYRTRDNERSFWGYFFRKGFSDRLKSYTANNVLSARIRDNETGRESNVNLTDVINEVGEFDTKKYDLLGFQCSSKLSLEQKENIEVDLIRSFVNTSNNLKYNKGNEFTIETHENGKRVTYAPDETENDVDIQELGKRLGLEVEKNSFITDFTKESKEYNRKFYGKDSKFSQKVEYSKADIVDSLFATLGINEMKGNMGLRTSIMEEVNTIQQNMYDKEVFTPEEFNEIVDCFSKDDLGRIHVLFNGENEKIGLSRQSNTTINVKQNGSVEKTTYNRSQFGNVEGSIKKNIEEYSSDGTQQSLTKYKATYSGMLAPKITDIDKLIKMGDMSQERFERRGNAVVVDRKMVAAYTYPYIKKDIYKTESYAYENVGKTIKEKELSDVKNILPEIETAEKNRLIKNMASTINTHIDEAKKEEKKVTTSKAVEEKVESKKEEKQVETKKSSILKANNGNSFEGLDFLDVVDDYLTGINLMTNKEKKEYQVYIKDTLQNGNVVTNMKMYDELMTRYENNKSGEDKSLANSAFAMASLAEMSVKKQMENMSESESNALLKDLREKQSYGEGKIEGLKMKDATPQTFKEIKDVQHRLDTYSKFADDLVNIKENSREK